MPKITDKDTARDLRDYESEFLFPVYGNTGVNSNRTNIFCPKCHARYCQCLQVEDTEAIRASREKMLEVSANPIPVVVSQEYFDRFTEAQEEAYPLVSVLSVILAILVVVAVGLWWWVR